MYIRTSAAFPILGKHYRKTNFNKCFVLDRYFFLFVQIIEKRNIFELDKAKWPLLLSHGERLTKNETSETTVKILFCLCP